MNIYSVEHKHFSSFLNNLLFWCSSGIFQSIQCLKIMSVPECNLDMWPPFMTSLDFGNSKKLVITCK